MKTSIVILLFIAAVFAIIALLSIFSGIRLFGERDSSNSQQEVPINTNTTQNNQIANLNEQTSAASVNANVEQIKASPLRSPDAIRLETVDGKPCYIVELTKIEPSQNPDLKTYRFVVDFGPFGDTCVRLSPPTEPVDGHDLFAKDGNAAGRRIGETTFREFIYQYE